MQQMWQFPTIVSVFTYPDHQTLAPRFAERIRSLVEEGGRTRTSDRLHEDPAFLSLV